VAISAGAALLLAFAGAFSTGDTPLPLRLFYWLTVMVGGALWGTGANALLQWLGVMTRGPWVYGALLTLVMGIPYIGVIWAANAVAFGNALTAQTFVHLIGPVLMIAAAMTGVILLAEYRAEAKPEATEPSSPPRFLDRLPPRLRSAEIHAVEAEDHYLRVHTDRGSDLILLRLGDAVSELEGVEGARTHRSWWVARAAVLEIDKGDGRAVLTVKGGLKVPVSRSAARDLRAAGWW
jgi:DNA-binding LytR/AlgR family response regulator